MEVFLEIFLEITLDTAYKVELQNEAEAIKRGMSCSAQRGEQAALGEEHRTASSSTTSTISTPEVE